MAEQTKLRAVEKAEYVPINQTRLDNADRLIQLARALLNGEGMLSFHRHGLASLHGDYRPVVLRAAAILVAAGASLIVDEAHLLPDDEDEPNSPSGEVVRGHNEGEGK